MQNDPDHVSLIDKCSKVQCRPESPRPFLNKSCNSNQKVELTKMDAAMQRVRCIYEANKERAEYLPGPTLNSIGLLPDGTITIKEDHAGGAREAMLLHQPRVISKKPPICNRKPQMTRLSAGLRETKSSSLRMIRDPEEVLRFKRKLIAGASQSQVDINTRLVPPTTKPCKIEKDRWSSNKQPAALERYKARSLAPDELIDIEDIPFDTLEEMENFMPELDRGNVKNTERRITKESLEEKEKTQRKIIVKHQKEDCTSNGEIVNVPVKDLKESLTPVKKEDIVLLNDRLMETTSDIKAQCHDHTRGDTPNNTKTNNTADKKEKKKKKKSRLSLKWLYTTKAEKVAPLPVKDEDLRLKPRSKADLERIATMFCVETPQQAGLRRFLGGQEYVDDDEAFIKPGVWNCDIGSQEEDHPQKPARKVDDRTDVNITEDGIRNMNLKNNGQCLENGAINGIHKMQKRLRKITKSAQ